MESAEKHLEILFPEPKEYHVGQRVVLAGRLKWEDLMRIPRAFAGVLHKARVGNDGAATLTAVITEGMRQMPNLVVELAQASGTTDITEEEVRSWPADAVLGYVKLHRTVNPDLFPNLADLVETLKKLLVGLGGVESLSGRRSSSSSVKESTPLSN